MTRRRFLKRGLAGAMVLAAGAAALLPKKANAYYSGPISDHFDGTRFFNPVGRSPKGLYQVARLYTSETWSTWPREVPSPFSDKPPSEVVGTKVRLSFIGHASWLIQTAGRNILIDPVYAERASPFSFAGPRRANSPGVSFDDLPRIHTIIVTHNHYDHMDLSTLARLWQRDRPLIVTPLGNDTIMRGEIPDIVATAVDWGDAADLGGGVAAHAVPTQHWSARGTRDRSHALWASFVVDTPAGKIYAVGDSGFGDGSTFRNVGRSHPMIRTALLPIGAYEPRWFMEGQHMNPADAVEAFKLCGAQVALGHHWGTFQLTTEPHDQPLVDLAQALEAAGISSDRFRAVRPGEMLAI